MNFRVALPLTMLISFMLTCGFLVLDRRSRDPGTRTAAPPPPANTEPAPPTNAEPPQSLSLSLAVEPPPSDSRAAALSPEPRAASQTEPDDHAKFELPIQFNYRRSPENAENYVVTLFNKAGQDLTLDLIVFNATSQRTVETQLSIESMRVKNIGVGDNLEIEQGDRITLHNPIYNDFVAEIRSR